MPTDFELDGTLYGELANDGASGEQESSSEDSDVQAPQVEQAVAQGTWDGAEERIEDDLVVVYMDGACRNNQDCKFRKAGVGVFSGRGHRSNISKPMDGSAQTNQRAELEAVRCALSLGLKSDSAYVVDGFAAHRHFCRQRGWHGISNADLWKQVDGLFERRQARGLVTEVVKMKRHAKLVDVRGGRATLWDKLGNDSADELAGAGADQHLLDLVDVRRAWLRMRLK